MSRACLETSLCNLGVSLAHVEYVGMSTLMLKALDNLDGPMPSCHRVTRIEREIAGTRGDYIGTVG